MQKDTTKSTVFKKKGLIMFQRIADMDSKTLMMLANMDESRIIKISKDDLRLEEEQLLWNAGLEKSVYEYWATLNGYWKAKKIPKCTCAEIEPNQKTGIGFMASEKYNPYFFMGEPCSMKWYAIHKEGRTDEYLKKANIPTA